ncbi:hypothetical protein [Streptomyces sp. NBC_00631]
MTRQTSRISGVGAGLVMAARVSRTVTVPGTGTRCAVVPVPPTQP